VKLHWGESVLMLRWIGELPQVENWPKFGVLFAKKLLSM